MNDRRHDPRPESSDRRTFPRPPLWLNLLLLVLGIAGLVGARMHRENVEKQFADVIAQEQRTPADVKAIKQEMAEMALSRESLQRELDGRMKFAASLKSENFYLSVDSKARKLRFYYGDSVLREADVTIGEQKTISANGKNWTFVPLKGAFKVEGKAVDYAWTVPEWAYAAGGQPPPAQPQVIPGGLGKYVLFLPNGYVLHTQPDPASPLKGAKPGSFLITEDFMRAVWPRITKGQTQVYIF